MNQRTLSVENYNTVTKMKNNRFYTANEQKTTIQMEKQSFLFIVTTVTFRIYMQLTVIGSR